MGTIYSTQTTMDAYAKPILRRLEAMYEGSPIGASLVTITTFCIGLAILSPSSISSIVTRLMNGVDHLSLFRRHNDEQPYDKLVLLGFSKYGVMPGSIAFQWRKSGRAPEAFKIFAESGLLGESMPEGFKFEPHDFTLDKVLQQVEAQMQARGEKALPTEPETSSNN